MHSPVRTLLAVLVVFALCLGGLAGCRRDTNPSGDHATTPQPSQARSLAAIFREVGEECGIRAYYDNGEAADEYAILETLGGGVAIFDYDRDGRMDVLLTCGGQFGKDKTLKGLPCRLFHNEGNWRFKDVTAEAGLDKALNYSHGCAVGDYDNDGWPDLLVTGYGRLVLYHNDQGKFREVTEAAGLLDHRPVHWSTSAAWGDFNGDGFLDLYVVHYVDWSFANHPRCTGYVSTQPVDTCSPKQFNPLPDALYLNNGDGTFRDATTEWGIKTGAEAGKGLGVVAADFNDDGMLDVYVANDTTDNHLYLNQNHAKFNEVGAAMGVAQGESGKPEGSMGVDVADYDGSGRLSIFVANFEGEVHALYRNTGPDKPFHHVSTRAGIAALGMSYVGFGAGFFDYDLDGAEDVMVSNGHVARHPPPRSTLAQRPVLLHNLRNRGDRPADVRFANVTNLGGPYFTADHRGRGLAFGDLDNDGRVDVVVSRTNSFAAVLRNELATGNHWLGIELVGKPQPDAIGALLTLEVDGMKLVRARKGGGSYLSSSDPRILFGLGQASKVGNLTIRWPRGRVETWDNLPIDRYVRVVEGDAPAFR